MLTGKEPLFSPELRCHGNKKDESPVEWLKAKSPGSTADTRSMLSGLAPREGKVPQCWVATDCHHMLPGPLYRSYLAVGTGYCRRVAHRVTGKHSLEPRQAKFNFCLGIRNEFHMVDLIYNDNLESGFPGVFRGNPNPLPNPAYSIFCKTSFQRADC